MSVEDIIEKIKAASDCVVLPPSGTSYIEEHLELPVDVREFYNICGGVILFQHTDYRVNVVSQQDFVLANPIIVGEICEADISSIWYIVAKDNEDEFLTIDLALDRLGRCYDSFYDIEITPINM